MTMVNSESMLGQPAAQEPRSDLVPGVVRCAKCAFQLHRTNLYLHSGTVGAGDSKTEPCPNGCGPLWPVTWETWAREGWAQAERLHMEKVVTPPAQAWVVADGQGTRWRKWGDLGPEWTTDCGEALHFSRRSDAEAFSKEDEDAWLIQPIAAPAPGIDLGPVRSALQAAEGLCACCAAVDGYSRNELHAFGLNMRQQFVDALLLIDQRDAAPGVGS